MSKSFYSLQGVKINPANPLYQDSVEIVYDGLLPSSGAQEVFAHVSFDSDWRSVQDYRMSKTDRGFETSLFLPEDAVALNICFRDAANNWDNNSGSNYTFDIETQKEKSWDKAVELPCTSNYSFLSESGQDLTALYTANVTGVAENGPASHGDEKDIPVNDESAVTTLPASTINSIGNLETVVDEMADRDKFKFRQMQEQNSLKFRRRSR
jgi:hypothetical protein